MGDRVRMGFFDRGDQGRLGGMSFDVPDCDEPVVAAPADHVRGFGIVGDVGHGRRARERQFRHIWVLKVPDVGLDRHFLRHLLEKVDCVGNGHFGRTFRRPGDLAD